MPFCVQKVTVIHPCETSRQFCSINGDNNNPVKCYMNIGGKEHALNRINLGESMFPFKKLESANDVCLLKKLLSIKICKL